MDDVLPDACPECNAPTRYDDSGYEYCPECGWQEDRLDKYDNG